MSLNSLLKFIYLLEVDWFINNEKYRSLNRVFLPPISSNSELRYYEEHNEEKEHCC